MRTLSENARLFPKLLPPSRVSPRLAFAVVIALFCVAGGPARAADDDKQEMTLFTVVVESKTGEVKVPKKLEDYKKTLTSEFGQQFALEKTQHTEADKKKAKSVTLAKKLGTVEISWDGKSATVKITQNKKLLSEVKVAKFPAYLVDRKIKVDGKQVILILDKGKK